MFSYVAVKHLVSISIKYEEEISGFQRQYVLQYNYWILAPC